MKVVTGMSGNPSPKTLIRISFFAFAFWLLANVFYSQQVKDPPKPETVDGKSFLKKGLNLVERGDTASALPVLQKAVQQLHAQGDTRREAEAYRGLGDVYAGQGEIFVPIAIENYQKAVDLFRSAAKSPKTDGMNVVTDMAYNAEITLGKMGDLYFRLGKFDDAQRFYSQIAPDKPSVAWLESAGKDYQRANTAKSTGSRGKNVGRRFGDLLSKKPSLSTLGDTQSTVNEASNVKDTAIGVVEELHRANLLLKTYILSDLSLGRVAELRGDEKTAQLRFDSAYKFATLYPPIFGQGAAAKRYQIVALTDQGDLAFRQNRHADAGKFYSDALKRAKDEKRPDLSWYAARGVGRSQWIMAQSKMEPTTEWKGLSPAAESAVGAYRDAVATIEDLRGRSIRGDEARQSFAAQTVVVLDEYTDILASLALQAAGSDHSRPLEGDALKYASQAFLSHEREKGRSLLDLLAASTNEIREGVDPALLQQRQELFEKQSELSNQLIGLGSQDRSAGNTDDATLEREIDRLSLESAHLESQLQSTSHRYAALTSPALVSMDEVQSRLLENDAAMLVYKIGGNRSYLWVVTKEKAWLYPLGARAAISDLASKTRELLITSSTATVPDPVTTKSPDATAGRSASAKGPSAKKTPTSKGGDTKTAAKTRDLKTVSAEPKLRPLVESPPARQYAETSFALYQAILAPASAVIQGKRLIVVTDDFLYGIPFEALVTSSLPTAGQTPADFAALPYLVRDHEISYAPSSTVLSVIRSQRPTGTESRAALLVADPVFDPDDPRAKGQSTLSPTETASRDLLVQSFAAEASASPPQPPSQPSASPSPQPAAASNSRIPRLPATRSEATSIANLVKQSGSPVDLLLDLDACERNLVGRDLRGYRIVHIATHGLLNPNHPELSGLLLSLVGNPPEQDGFLRTQEVFNLKLGSPLVMLSACKTGLGKIQKGEGLVGLTRAFMYAGAQTVGVSLWPVDDVSTAMLMVEFYNRILFPKTEAAKTAPTIAGAMRGAQLKLIDERRYSPPFFWAPFVLVGDSM